jgi:hypothetical protein
MIFGGCTIGAKRLSPTLVNVAFSKSSRDASCIMDSILVSFMPLIISNSIEEGNGLLSLSARTGMQTILSFFNTP